MPVSHQEVAIVGMAEAGCHERCHRDWDPDVHGTQCVRAPEAGRRDPDNGERLPVDVDGGTDSIRRRGEESSRRSVAQNRDTGIGGRPIVSRYEQPPCARPCAENLKVAGDDLSW